LLNVSIVHIVGQQPYLSSTVRPVPTTQQNLPTLVPNLFELLPLYAQIFLLAGALIVLAVGAGFVIRVARSAFGRSTDSGDPSE
jgi:hypothetical protein